MTFRNMNPDYVKENKESFTCFSCGLFHEKVEARGMWHCPNSLCRGSGGAWFRQRLDSYKELYPNGSHTINHAEWLKKGRQHNEDNGINIKNFHIEEN